MLQTLRHDEIFNHTAFLEPVHVIGVGGIGSEVVRGLIKLGVGRVNELHVWDDDTVAPHNLANQAYSLADVGMSKVAALGRHATSWSGVTLHEHRKRVEERVDLSGVVFVCVDSMRARWELWWRNIKHNPRLSLCIETRMDATYATVHTLNPNEKEHVHQWERFWYPDEKTTDRFGCGGHVAVGPTAVLVANLALWQFIRFAATRHGEEDALDNQIRLKLRPLSLTTYQW